MVMTDAYWRIDCCGVVSAWEVRVAAEGDLDLQVWEVTDATARQAILRGSYSFFGKFDILLKINQDIIYSCPKTHLTK